MTAPGSLQPIIDSIPTKPGCYLMKDKDGSVIYVGKAGSEIANGHAFEKTVYMNGRVYKDVVVNTFET